jgi:hypothetical protein
MAHVDYPTDFLGQTILLGNIITQVGLDGPDGPLAAMLVSKGIDLTKDNTACAAAIINNNLFLTAAKSSKKFCQQRNTLMKPIMKHLRGSFQFLKSLFTPNFKALGNWGATITTTGKINYPSGTQARVDLFMLMKEENDSYTTPPSPLLPFLTQNTINLDTDATNGATALLRHQSFTTANTKAEDYRELRDNGWANPLINIHVIGDFLMKFFIGNQQAAGDYGFNIVNEAEEEKERILNMNTGESKTYQQVKLGSSIGNTGDGSIFIYKGKKVAGEPLEIKAGETIIATKGYAIFSANNPSSTKKGQLTLIPKKNTKDIK